jgi:hypothetical protein
MSSQAPCTLPQQPQQGPKLVLLLSENKGSSQSVRTEADRPRGASLPRVWHQGKAAVEEEQQLSAMGNSDFGTNASSKVALTPVPNTAKISALSRFRAKNYDVSAAAPTSPKKLLTKTPTTTTTTTTRTTTTTPFLPLILYHSFLQLHLPFLPLILYHSFLQLHLLVVILICVVYRWYTCGSLSLVPFCNRPARYLYPGKIYCWAS